MKVKLAILALLLFFGGFAVKKGLELKNSPTVKVIQQLQDKKEIIEELQKSPLQLPTQLQNQKN
tara:strand:+ start:12862 stop:13053 length:192 start_codon:yes stop_codon:yes gene_type:complete